MTQYIPYSIRNNITDPDLAGLLDYLEREMGWEITIDGDYGYLEIVDRSPRIVPYCVIEVYDNPSWIRIVFEKGEPMNLRSQVFFRTYKSILPTMRDLYRNK